VYPTPADVEKLDADPARCLDADASRTMVAEIDQAHKDGDTLGGVVEVLAYGVPVGLGWHGHWDRRLDARLDAALMGIQAIKGVAVGDGFDLARVPGSKAHNEIVRTEDGVKRSTGRSGGTEGGSTTVELLRVRAGTKPTATEPRALATIDVSTG
jgi:chorismate synthase